MNYVGVVIEESLEDKSVLKDVKILSTKVEPVTEYHKTPWIKQWTLHTVEVDEENARNVAEKISKAIDSKHDAWYADFKNDKFHYVIYHDKIFLIDRGNKKEYEEATRYGVSIGIPDYQVDFSPDIKEWERQK